MEEVAVASTIEVVATVDHTMEAEEIALEVVEVEALEEATMTTEEVEEVVSEVVSEKEIHMEPGQIDIEINPDKLIQKN